MSRETYSVYLLPHHEESSQLCFQPINISIFELFVPFLGLTWNINFCLFCQNGLIPKSDFGQFKSSPIFELSVQMDYPMRTLEEDICFVEMGWFQNRIFVKFRFSPNFELSVQMAYPMRNLEEDICFVEMGWFQNWTLIQFRFSPNLELSVQMAYPMRTLEEDKAIEVRSEIICTRLGC